MLLPIILVLAILAASALAYYFYSRSAALPSADAQVPSNTDSNNEGGAVTTPTGDDPIESSSADNGSSDIVPSRTDDTSKATPPDTSRSTSNESTSVKQTDAVTKVRETPGGSRDLFFRMLKIRHPQSPPATDTPKPTTSTKPSVTQTTPSPKPNATQSPPSPTKVSNSGKKGAGYNKVEYAQQLELDWAYNWASNPGGQPGKGVMYVPQLWGAKTDAWDKEATATIEAGATHVLG